MIENSYIGDYDDIGDGCFSDDDNTSLGAPSDLVDEGIIKFSYKQTKNFIFLVSNIVTIVFQYFTV